MYISDLNLYLFARNHSRSQTTLGLHTLVQIGFVHLQGSEMNTVGSGWMRSHNENSSGFYHPSVRSHRRAQSPASRISVVVVFSAVHFRNRTIIELSRRWCRRKRSMVPKGVRRWIKTKVMVQKWLQLLQWISPQSFAIWRSFESWIDPTARFSRNTSL